MNRPGEFLKGEQYNWKKKKEQKDILEQNEILKQLNSHIFLQKFGKKQKEGKQKGKKKKLF